MTADVELLPLPEHMKAWARSLADDAQAYARANVEHHTAAKDAEIEALRAEVDEWKAVAEWEGEQHDRVFKEARALNERAERLAEALHRLEEACDDSDGAQYGTLGTSFVRDVCAAALHPINTQENT